MSTSYAFTTSTRLQHRLSTAGVTLRSDDDAGAIADRITDATVEILGYTQLLYDPDSLSRSDWIEQKARDIAAYFLCTRRGNPAPKPVEARYEKAIHDLELVQQGQWIIPDAAQRKANVPVLTNQRAAQWPVNRVVNTDGKSTGTPEGYQPHPDNSDFLDYSV